jgi:hypothetical protein
VKLLDHGRYSYERDILELREFSSE